MNQAANRQAEEDFQKARNKALLNDIQHFLNPDETELLSFYDVKNILKPNNEVYLGMKVVPVNLIAGSEGRYRDFDNHFFPKSMHLRTRWEKIDQAHLTNVILPPITLYEIGGLYFVRDGNHRVSVARTQGIENIDAEVVSLQSEIKLKPGLTKFQLLKAVIAYEKRIFYSETGFGDITDYWDIDFSSPGQYDVIYNHILIHKYYMNEHQADEISMHDAILDWFKNVYIPVILVIKQYHLLRKFKKRTTGDLYVWLIKYWDELKQKYGSDYSLDEAALDFTDRFGRSGIRRLFARIKKFFQT